MVVAFPFLFLVLSFLIAIPLGFVGRLKRRSWSKMRLILAAASPLPLLLTSVSLLILVFGLVDWLRGWSFASEGYGLLLFIAAAWAIPIAAAGYLLGMGGAAIGQLIANALDPENGTQ